MDEEKLEKSGTFGGMMHTGKSEEKETLGRPKC